MISALFFILFFLLAHTHRTAVFSEIFSRYFFRKPFKLFHSVFGGGFFAAFQIIPVHKAYRHEAFYAVFAFRQRVQIFERYVFGRFIRGIQSGNSVIPQFFLTYSSASSQTGKGPSVRKRCAPFRREKA